MVKPFKCPKCKRTTEFRHKFCPDCGEPLAVECSKCGESWRFYLKHKYCPSCGTKITNK